MKTIRERYLEGLLFNVGDLVSGVGLEKIVTRCANYVITENVEGIKNKRWLTDVTPLSEDLYSSDYKIGKNGRKYPAHRVDFRNSTLASKSKKVVDDTRVFSKLSNEGVESLLKLITISYLEENYGNDTNVSGFDCPSGVGKVSDKNNLGESEGETERETELVCNRRGSPWRSDKRGTAESIVNSTFGCSLSESDELLIAKLLVFNKLQEIEKTE